MKQRASGFDIVSYPTGCILENKSEFGRARMLRVPCCNFRPSSQHSPNNPFALPLARIGLLFGCVYLSALGLNQCFGQDSSTSAPSVESPSGMPSNQTLVGAIQRMRTESIETIDLDIVVTATYWDPARQKLFVQDQGEARYVKLAQRLYRTTTINFGDRIRIKGNMRSSVGRIDADSIEVIDTNYDVVPIELHSVASLRKGAYWSNLVEFEAVLKGRVSSEGQTQLIVESGGREIICYIGMPDDLPSYPIGSKLRVVGVLDWDTYQTGAPRHPMCQVLDGSNITLLEDAETTHQLEIIAEDQIPLKIDIGTALAPSTEMSMSNELVRVSGEVAFIRGGEDFLVSDDTGSISVTYVGGDLLELGHLVEVTGFVEQGESVPRLSPQEIRVVARADSDVVALELSARNIIVRNIDRQIVSTNGTLESVSSSGVLRHLRLVENGIVFRLVFSATDSQYERLNLVPGVVVRCRGMVIQKGDSDDVWFEIRANRLSNVWITRDSSAKYQRWLLYFIAGTLFISILSVAWLTTMRRQVKVKTKHLEGLTARLNASYEAIDEGILVVDQENQVASANANFEKITGIRTSSGDDFAPVAQQLCSLLRASDENTVSDVLLGQATTSGDLELRTNDDQRHLLCSVARIRDTAANPLGRLFALKDVTEHRHLEAKLIQSQKMEAVGTLAGGVAHDFNNLLTVISFNIEMAQESIRERELDDQELEENFKETRYATERASHLVKNLLGFSRCSTLEMTKTSLNDVVTNIAGLVSRSFDSSVVVQTELCADLWPIEIDSTHIEQVVMNLCLNARDSLKNGEGTIKIQTENTVVDGEPYALLRVLDNGTGMTEEVRNRVFEPFFTTKRKGEGTGLGLSISYGIIAQHEGRLHCESTPNVGSCLEVLLPRFPAEEIGESADKITREEPSLIAAHQTGHSQRFDATVLVVDDEQAVRKSTCFVMNSLGCNVVEASNGREALELIERMQFDLVLLDLNMPIMDGREVFANLTNSHPELPVAIVTGYAMDAKSFSKEFGAAPSAIVTKPFRREDMSAVCDSILNCAAHS